MQVHIIDMHHHASIFIWFYLYVCPHGGTLASYTTPPRHNRHRFLMVFARPGYGSTLTYTDIAPWNILEQVSSCSASRRPLDSFQVAPRTPPMPKALGEKKKRKENKERKKKLEMNSSSKRFSLKDTQSTGLSHLISSFQLDWVCSPRISRMQFPPKAEFLLSLVCPDICSGQRARPGYLYFNHPDWARKIHLQGYAQCSPPQPAGIPKLPHQPL